MGARVVSWAFGPRHTPAYCRASRLQSPPCGHPRAKARGSLCLGTAYGGKGTLQPLSPSTAGKYGRDEGMASSF
jgi:hypothetical protein